MRSERSDVIRSSPARRLAAWIGFPVAGFAAGVLITLAIELAARGVMHRADIFQSEMLRLGVGGLVGFAIGVLVAVGFTSERLRARIDDESIEITWDQVHATAPRHAIASVVADGDLVVLARDGRELVRVAGQLDVTRLTKALNAHGYPQLALADPYNEAFNEWREGDARLSDTIHRYVAAYEASLTARSLTDAEHLRRALVAQGVAVRRRGSRIEWRHLGLRRVPAAA